MGNILGLGSCIRGLMYDLHNIKLTMSFRSECLMLLCSENFKFLPSKVIFTNFFNVVDINGKL